MGRYFKKAVVFVLTSAAMMCFFISALAEELEETGVTGSGQVEGTVRPYVYQVILPTDVDGIFDFIMDPQRLIEETNAATYGGLSFEKGATLFFQRSDGQAEDFSSYSDSVTIVNRSNMPVDVLVNVSISAESLGGISLSDSRTFEEGTGASLYMALTDGMFTIPIGIDGAYLQTTLPAAPEEAFEYVYDQEQGEYSYGLKKNPGETQFPEYSFRLTGAVNEDEGWAEIGRVAPVVTVTWKVIPVQDAVPEQSAAFSQKSEPESEPELEETNVGETVSGNTVSGGDSSVSGNDVSK